MYWRRGLKCMRAADKKQRKNERAICKKHAKNTQKYAIYIHHTHYKSPLAK